jgi:hypothetical protein
MSDLRCFGWVTNDLEPQVSSRKNLYVRFGLAEHIGPIAVVDGEREDLPE